MRVSLQKTATAAFLPAFSSGTKGQCSTGGMKKAEKRRPYAEGQTISGTPYRFHFRKQAFFRTPGKFRKRLFSPKNTSFRIFHTQELRGTTLRTPHSSDSSPKAQPQAGESKSADATAQTYIFSHNIYRGVL